MNSKTLIGLIVGLVAILVGGFLYMNSQKSNNTTQPQKSKDATISGTIGFNGTHPDGATFSVGQRVVDPGATFNMFVQNMPVKDGTVWSWNGAVESQNYEIQAYLLSSDGKVLHTSEILTVSAPASDEVLNINSDAGPAPTPHPQTNQVAPATISGTFDLNGYYTNNTTITILSKVPGTSGDYTVAASGLAAKDNGAWSWGGAAPDTTYELKARFISSTGTNIGESPKIVATAPATGEVFVINSTAQPPPPAGSDSTGAGGSTTPPQGANAPAVSGGTVSGTINFNGVSPANSSIVILARDAGTTNPYQVVLNGIQPVSNASWNWNSATAGKNYDIIAVLKQTNSNNTQTDVATSQNITVTSPAAKESLTINSNASIPSPKSDNIIRSCTNKNQSNNTWSVQVSFPTVTGAQTYWIQLGTASGGSDLVNTAQTSQNSPSQNITATINDSPTYYARYSYSNIQSASWNSNSFSPFSGTFQFKCP